MAFLKPVTKTNTLLLTAFVIIATYFTVIFSAPYVHFRKILSRNSTDDLSSYFKAHSVAGKDHFNYQICLDLYENELATIQSSDLATKCCSLLTYRNCLDAETAKTCSCQGPVDQKNLAEMLVKTVEKYLDLEDPGACTGYTTTYECTDYLYNDHLLASIAVLAVLSCCLLIHIIYKLSRRKGTNHLEMISLPSV